MPQPCEAGLSVIAVHPTGNALLNWARRLANISIDAVEKELEGVVKPSSVTAIPYVSGSMAYWEDGRKAKGGLIGLTLATSKSDVVQAFMESVGYDTVNTLSMMKEEGVEVERIQITGGGARSPWWTQFKADVTNMPIEVVEHPEPGTRGAALLAGYAIGLFDDLAEIAQARSDDPTVYMPDPERAALHQERLEEYRHLITVMLAEIY